MRLPVPSPSLPVVTPAQDQVWLTPMPGERMAVLVRSGDVGGACTVIESVAAPRSGPPLHVHAAEDETFHILEGTLRFRCAGEEFDAPAGTRVTIPRGTAHAWRNVSDAPTRMLAIFTPGRIEGLFEAISGQPLPVVEHLAARFDTFIVGPPLAA